MNIAAMSRTARPAAVVIVLFMAGVVSPAAFAANGEGWDWIVAPYLWAVSLDTDVQRTQPPVGGVSTDTGFDDIIDKLDGAFQIHIEGQEDHWGMFADFTYLGLGDENDRERFHTESDIDVRIFELAGVWSPDGERYRGLDVFAGLRYFDVDLTVQFDPNNPLFSTTTFDGSQTFNDFMIGARYTWALSDRWGVTLRGDGSFGDTEGTWNASVLGNYKTRNGAWFFGYRHMSVELETGDTNTELAMSGPMFGYGFAF